VALKGKDNNAICKFAVESEIFRCNSVARYTVLRNPCTCWKSGFNFAASTVLPDER